MAPRHSCHPVRFMLMGPCIINDLFDNDGRCYREAVMSNRAAVDGTGCRNRVTKPILHVSFCFIVAHQIDPSLKKNKNIQTDTENRFFGSFSSICEITRAEFLI